MKPIIYLYFHSKILEWKGKAMKRRDFLSCFFQWRIPKNLRYYIMKDMEKLEIIRLEKKHVYLNDVYIKQPKAKKKIDIKDGNTQEENPYFHYNNL